MVSACSAYLVEKLRAVMGPDALGNPVQIHTTMKDLKADVNSDVGAVLIRDDTPTFYGRPLRNLDTGREDTRLYDREVVFDVVLGAQSMEKLDPVFERFLATLGCGFGLQGHFISLDLTEPAEWADKKDSILNAEIAVRLPVTFRGGVYLPARTARIKDVKIERTDSDGK